MSAISTIKEPLTSDLGRICRIIDDELFSDSPLVNDLCQHLRAYRGKMLRPTLLLLSADACDHAMPEHLILGAVIEIVHIATLVHDDVLDEADMRRRQPTINRLQGNEAAVLLGDYLISHAFHLCSTVDTFACRHIGATTNTVCEGELQQVLHRGNWNLTISQYLDIISRKTAALTSAACLLGAHYAGADEATTAALQQYGVDVGIAFQITDDVLDIQGSQECVGKTLGRDLAENKLTLPVIHALANADPLHKAKLMDLLKAPTPDRAKLADMLKATNSIHFALRTANDYVQSACTCLDALPPSESQAALGSLANAVLGREL